ncbi:gamma-glutamylcyclotransferase family protein [Nocardia sp. BMG111209]|uniref:gamma-glutamylcyclotransferase family protein n=1 Tax=Nocardia sp. BMG111209 TaxID=1160137 RepID=UPI0018CA1787|nr:gamma-glutamylcyclotransferase family protein [Nocardia sp. BMG111209]
MASATARVHIGRADVLGTQGISSSATMPLFAYGTLQAGEVLHTLIGRIPETTPGVANGWRIARLPDRVYPGLVPSAGHTAAGRVITGLTPQEWLLLDRFEDEDYDLELLTLAGGFNAWAYVWKRAVEPTDWDLDEFSSSDLPAYVDRCAAWLVRDANRQS